MNIFGGCWQVTSFHRLKQRNATGLQMIFMDISLDFQTYLLIITPELSLNNKGLGKWKRY